MHPNQTKSSITIYFDGECPFCSNYVKYLRLKRAVGTVHHVDLRNAKQKRQYFEELGINLDQGMVVEFNGQIYHGDQAVKVLASMSTRIGFFNRFNSVIFSNTLVSQLLYPILRMGRNATLFLLGRKSLSFSDSSLDSLFVLFSFVWGFLGFLHFLVYATQFAAPLYATTYMIPALGLLLMFMPASRRIFLALTIVMIIDGWLQLPTLSNHTIIKNFFLLSMLIAGIWQWVHGGNWRGLFRQIAPLGRVLLITMYFFGVFHKINTDFLNPEVSCAVTLWREMPVFFSFIDFSWMHYLAIYGALIIESLILFSLLYRKTRHIGILAGICFHSLLGLSGYAFYPPFSTLTIALHILFISPNSAKNILDSPEWKTLTHWIHSFSGCLIFFTWLAIISVLAWLGNYSNAAIIWLPGVVIFAIIMFKRGRDQSNTDLAGGKVLLSQSRILNVLSLLFLFNCITPYLGLKTSQSINMFANLRLEGGYSNHLVLQTAPAPFDYLNDVVTITSSIGSHYLSYISTSNLHVVYYDLLRELNDNPLVTVNYIRDSIQYNKQNALTLKADIDQVLHPEWFRKWFNFNPVDLQSPKPCALNR